MTLRDMMNQITDLGAQIRSAAAALAQKAGDPTVKVDDLTAAQANLAAMNERMKALQAAAEIQRAAEASGVQPMAGAPAAPRSVQDMRKSNEYARAFAYALKRGYTPDTGRGDERVKILYDALTEGGGDPVGTDGGFLVPEDIDHSIIELRRALDPLAALFNEETVTAPTGWRVMDTAPTKGLVDVDEMGQIDDDDDQPAFAKVPYSVSKKALILPVSNELMTDNVANLFAYISRWFAKKLVITENGMLIAALRHLTAVSIDSDIYAGLTSALNVGLDPAISATASIITNQSGFNALDLLMDNNERPLLQPDPTNAAVKRFKSRAIHAVSNGSLGNVTEGEGASATTTADIFLGDGRAYATLFRCGGYELTSTNIGGNAWRTDSTELRGIVRLGVSVFDTGAMVRKTITVA